MKVFIVLCLVAAACADVSSLTGYNYGSGSSDGGVSGGLFGSGSNEQGVAASNVAPSVDSGDLGSHGAGVGAGVEKEFYSFSANEEEFDQPEASEQIANSLKRNLRVVFIKGPENKGLEDAALALAKHASDQKTAIYVLNKQADIGDLANKLNAANSQNHNKPEVHFVKYRTPEDAHNAQSQIQNQYDALGGSSQSHNGGVAPVLDFASKGHSGSGSGSSLGGSYSASHPSAAYAAPVTSYAASAAAPSHSYVPPASPSNSYIPPSIFRRLRL